MSAPEAEFTQWLLARGLLTPAQLRVVQAEQEATGVALDTLLLRLGFVSAAALQQRPVSTAVPVLGALRRQVSDPRLLALLPRELAIRHAAFPLAFDADSGTLDLAMSRPHDNVALAHIRQQGGARCRQLRTHQAAAADIAQAIGRAYGHAAAVDDALRALDGSSAEVIGRAPVDGNPVVQLVDSLIADAAARDASDIHLEPEQTFVRIRYRLDGVMQLFRTLDKRHWPAMLTRLKILSGMNIAETRAPQDGRFSQSPDGRRLDVRAATQPTLHGENLVLRLLDRQREYLSLDGLGLPDAQQALLRALSARPAGILLVTGPTGSGKTTTLYAVLSLLDSTALNIMTLEDPVEYPMPGIRQTSITDNVKLDFASGIRSLMRQDPDAILVGEIRDADTAAMAFRAAMTGHQVFATLHAPTALGVLPRLLDLGVCRDTLVGNVSGILGQRLVRRLCPHCRQADRPDAGERRLLGVSDGEVCLFRPRGCEACLGSGYRGRFMVAELLRIDADIDAAIGRHDDPASLRRLAKARGFSELAEQGCARVLAGDTSLEEIIRTIDLSERR